MRHCWRFFDYHALCETCGWTSGARNALGNAARHHDATGHTVSVEVKGHVSYCGDQEHERRQAKKVAN